MENAPAVISDKDLLYLKDIFGWNLNTLKLVREMKDKIDNDEISNLFDDICEIHKEICEDVVTILK